MPDLVFYTHGLCPYAQRVALALKWKNIPHQKVDIDLSNKPDWYEQRLGTSLVPAIELKGVPYTESLDIIRLLEKQFAAAPPLMPEDPAQQAAVEALIKHSGTLQSAGWRLLGGAWNFPSAEKLREVSPDGARAWAQALTPLVESIQVHGGPYLVGKLPTLADVTLAPFLKRIELAARYLRDFDTHGLVPGISHYLDVLDYNGGWQSTFPDPEAFGDAIFRFSRLDYFDYIHASLEHPSGFFTGQFGISGGPCSGVDPASGSLGNLGFGTNKGSLGDLGFGRRRNLLSRHATPHAAAAAPAEAAHAAAGAAHTTAAEPADEISRGEISRGSADGREAPGKRRRLEGGAPPPPPPLPSPRLPWDQKTNEGRIRKRQKLLYQDVHRVEEGEFGTYLVTGSTDGIGRFTVECLAKAGHVVLVHGKNADKVKEVSYELLALGARGVYGYTADLSLMSEVRRMAAEILSEHDVLHGMLNNAGTFGVKAPEPNPPIPWMMQKGSDTVYATGKFKMKRVETREGNEYTLAVNVLAPFLLTSILLPAIQASGKGRILFTSSVEMGSGGAVEKLTDLQCKKGWSAHKSYALSKLCDAIIATELNIRYGDSPRLCVNTLDPGAIDTKLLRMGWGCFGAPANTSYTAYNMLTAGHWGEMSGKCTTSHFMCDFGPIPYEEVKKVAITGRPSFWNIFRKPKDFTSKELDYSGDLKHMSPRVALSSPGRRGQVWDELMALTGARWPPREGKGAPDVRGRRLQSAAAAAPFSWEALAAEAAALNDQIGCCRPQGNPGAACAAQSVSYTEESHPETAEGVCERRRRRRLQVPSAPGRSGSADGASDCAAGGLCETEAAWFAEWGERLGCWWLALPMPTQGELAGCLGALGLHLGARFDAAVRRVGGAPPAGAAGASEPGCEWVGERAERLQLPDFPARGGFDFTLPPIPRLLPDWQQLLSFSTEHQLQLAAAAGATSGVGGATRSDEPPSRRQPMPQRQQQQQQLLLLSGPTVAAGACVGVLASVVIAVAVRRSQRHGRPSLRSRRPEASGATGGDRWRERSALGPKPQAY